MDRVFSNEDIDGFPVTAIFHWGVENTTVTDVYQPGERNTINDTYYYNEAGFYTTGFSLVFGEGAAGCSGKTITNLDTLGLSSGCSFDAETPPPTPGSTVVISPEPTMMPTKNPITMFPTATPTVAPSSPPSILEPIVTTTTTTTTTTAATTTTSSKTPVTTSTTVLTTVSPTTTTIAPEERHAIPTSITLFNVDELNPSALSKWGTKTIQQINTHSENENIIVTLENVSQLTLSRRFLRQQQEKELQKQQDSRILAEDGSLQIDFNTVIESESNEILTRDQAVESIVSGFSTSARQTEYIYSLKSADSATFGDIDRMFIVVDGRKIIIPQTPIDIEEVGGIGMGVIIGAAGGVLALFILIGSIFYTKKKKKKRRQQEPKKLDSPTSKDSKGYLGDETMGKEWSMQNSPISRDEQTCATPYLGTIESREGEDDVSTLGDPYFGEAIDARDTGTVAESMVSSDMLALGVKRSRGVGSSNASRMDATTATGYTTTGPGLTFADDTTLDDAYQTSDAIQYEEEEDEDYERIVVVAPPGKLGIVIDNPAGNIPFVHAIKETSVLHGKVQAGDLVLAVDEVDCRGMHSMSVSRLISKRSDSERTLRLLRNSAC